MLITLCVRSNSKKIENPNSFQAENMDTFINYFLSICFGKTIENDLKKNT